MFGSCTIVSFIVKCLSAQHIFSQRVKLLIPISYFFRIFDGLCPLIAGIMNVLGITLALAVFIHRRVSGNDDVALDLTSPETSAISSYYSTATASTAGM